MLSAASERTELDDYGDASFLEGLTTLVDAINSEAGFTAAGERRVEEFITHSLANRLDIEHFHKTHPGASERGVKKPLFVFGLPRSGTTLAINLLNEDPARRCLLRWEANNSVPPPTTQTLTTDPRCIREQALVDASVQHAPHISAIHHENAHSPTECQFIMSQNFCAQYYEAIAAVPTYRAWWLQADYLPTFKYHKRLLQVLQWQAPGRWTLKNPWHALYLDDLTAVYPDAQLVMTHRDPVKVIGSFCSLIKNVRAMFSDDIDTLAIGSDIINTFEQMYQRTIDYRERNGWDSVYDLHYENLTKDPVGEIHRLYAHFDEPCTPDAGRAMQRYIDGNPKGKHGGHTYSLEEYGLDKQTIERRFLEYYARFNVSKES